MLLTFSSLLCCQGLLAGVIFNLADLFEDDSGFPSQSPLSKSHCELSAFDMAREKSEETAEQENSEMLRLTSHFW